MYLLDTNAVIDFCNAKLPSNAKKLLSEIDPAISVITRIELFASNKIPDEEKRVLEGFIGISTVYDNINEAIVSRAISIRQQHNIKLPDSIIAATALAYNRILISRNTNDFQGVKGGALANIGAEVGYSAFKGGFVGGYSGLLSAAVDGRDPGEGFLNGIKNGAIGGAALAGVTISALGPAYVPDKKYGDFGDYAPVYRSGTFISRFLFGESSGVAIGRNLVTHQYKEDPIFYGQKYSGSHANDFLRAHETAHYQQQIELGFALFCYRTLSQYFNLKFNAQKIYGTPGTLEYNADQYAKRMFGQQYILKP